MRFFPTAFVLSFAPLIFYRGGIPFGAVILFALEVVTLWALAWKVHRLKWPKKSSLASVFMGTLCLLFTLLFFLANVYSVVPEYGAHDFFLWMAGLGLFFLSSLVMWKEEERAIVLNGFIFLAFLSTCAGFIFYLTLAQPRFFGSFGDVNESWNAFPNAYASLLLLLLPAVIHLFLRAQKKDLLIWTLTLAILSTGFFLSLSRGAILVFFVVCILAVLSLRPERNILWISFKKILMVSLLTTLLLNGFQWLRSEQFPVVSVVEKAVFQADEGTASRDERVDFWLHSLRMIQIKPWLGSGPESFRFVYPQYQESFGVLAAHPHNLFLKIGVEEGLIALGVLVFLSGFFWCTNLLTKNIRNPYFWGLLGVFLHQMIDYNFNFSALVFVVALFAGWLWGDLNREQSHSALFQPLFPLHRLMQWGVTLGLVLFAGLALHELYYKTYHLKGSQAMEKAYLQEAEHFFEIAESQIWDEGLVLDWARARAFVGDFEGACALLDKTLQVSKDAQVYSLRGALSEDADPGIWFERALDLDPQNHIQYYYDVKRTSGYDLDTLVQLLKDYNVLLAQNEHNTLISENPYYADKLYGYLLSTLKDQEDRAEVQLHYQDFQAIWAEEIEKFEALYKVSL